MYITIPKGTKLTSPLNSKDIILQEDIQIPIKAHIIYEADLDELNIHESCCELDKLKAEIEYSLAFDYDDYGLENEENLYGKETIRYKYRLLELFKEDK